jgi:hypothetical protein
MEPGYHGRVGKPRNWYHGTKENLVGNTSTKCSYDFLALDVSEADVLAFREHLASAALYAPKDVSMLATQVVSEDMSALGPARPAQCMAVARKGAAQGNLGIA